MKAFSQYSWSVWTRVIRRDAAVLIAKEINTTHKTGTQFAKVPCRDVGEGAGDERWENL